MKMDDKLAQAKRVRKNINAQLRRLTAKSLNGDTNAAHRIIVKMTELEVKLKDLGFRITEDDEKPVLVPITEEWLVKQRANETILDKLLKEARHGDQEKIRKVILFMAKECK